VRTIATALLALVLGGCTASRVFIASSCDYADYRRVRLGETLEDRLGAAFDYLDERPDGRYADVVKRWFDRAEPVYYAVRRSSAAGLEAYLRALPRGPHADEALARLGNLRDESRREEVVVRQTGQRLDMDKEQRAAATELLAAWVLPFAEPAAWRGKFSEAPGELLARWEVALPGPVCDVHPEYDGWQRCAKAVSQSYRVAGVKGGRRVEREVSFLVSLDLADTFQLRTVTISGPAILVRTQEAKGGKELDDEDDAVRTAAARDFATRLTEALFARELVCNGGSDESGRTQLDCEKIHLSVEPGRGGDDVVTITRTDAPPPPPSRPPPAPEDY
jgi:hypothetical protein